MAEQLGEERETLDRPHPTLGHRDPHLVIDLTFRAFLKSLNLHEVMAGLYGTRLGDQFIEEALILSSTTWNFY